MKTTLLNLRQIEDAYKSLGKELLEYRKLYLSEHSIFEDGEIAYFEGVKYEVVSSNISYENGVVLRLHPFTKKGTRLRHYSKDVYAPQSKCLKEKFVNQTEAK